MDEDEYVNGGPEFVAEIGDTTESIDLHLKKTDYEKAGVREYLVMAIRTRRIYWFVRRRGKFKEMKPGPDGLHRSVIFPGLWLDGAALLHRDRKRLLAALHEGLVSEVECPSSSTWRA